MSINTCTISGNITADSELRITASGTKVLQFCVAVNDRRRNDQTGEWEDYANFIDCVMFGTRAEKLSEYLAKGIKVAVVGRLHWSSWETKDGSHRSKVNVIVSDLEFLSGKVKAEDGSATSQTKAKKKKDSTDVSAEVDDLPVIDAGASIYDYEDEASLYDDEIPF